jgi:hypothetical protein
MTTRKKPETGKGSGKGEEKAKKLHLNRETLRDLAVRKGSGPKGGRAMQDGTYTGTCGTGGTRCDKTFTLPDHPCC